MASMLLHRWCEVLDAAGRRSGLDRWHAVLRLGVGAGVARSCRAWTHLGPVRFRCARGCRSRRILSRRLPKSGCRSGRGVEVVSETRVVQRARIGAPTSITLLVNGVGKHAWLPRLSHAPHARPLRFAARNRASAARARSTTAGAWAFGCHAPDECDRSRRRVSAVSSGCRHARRSRRSTRLAPPAGTSKASTSISDSIAFGRRVRQRRRTCSPASASAHASRRGSSICGGGLPGGAEHVAPTLDDLARSDRQRARTGTDAVAARDLARKRPVHHRHLDGARGAGPRCEGTRRLPLPDLRWRPHQSRTRR